jgi:hypothetical protein
MNDLLQNGGSKYGGKRDEKRTIKAKHIVDEIATQPLCYKRIASAFNPKAF